MSKKRDDEDAVIASSGNIFADLGRPDAEESSVWLDQRVFNLDPETFAQLQAILDAPPRDNPKLRRLMATKAPWEA